jgi:hypothetical protein
VAILAQAVGLQLLLLVPCLCAPATMSGSDSWRHRGVAHDVQRPPAPPRPTATTIPEVLHRSAMRLGATWKHLSRDLAALGALDQYEVIVANLADVLQQFAALLSPRAGHATLRDDVSDMIELLSILAHRPAVPPAAAPLAHRGPPTQLPFKGSGKGKDIGKVLVKGMATSLVGSSAAPIATHSGHSDPPTQMFSKGLGKGKDTGKGPVMHEVISMVGPTAAPMDPMVHDDPWAPKAPGGCGGKGSAGPPGRVLEGRQEPYVEQHDGLCKADVIMTTPTLAPSPAQPDGGDDNDGIHDSFNIDDSNPVEHHDGAPIGLQETEAWSALVARLIQVGRFVNAVSGSDSECDSSDCSPELVDQGTHARGAWASFLGCELAKLAPSGADVTLVVGARLVSRVEVTSCGVPFQHTVPAGSRGKIKHIADDYFTIDFPCAVHDCGVGCLMFDFPDLPCFAALVEAGSAFD